MALSIENIDYKGIIAEYILHNAFDLTIKGIKRIVNKSNSDIRKEADKLKDQSKRDNIEINLGKYFFTTSEEELQDSLEFNLKNAFNWSSEIKFRNLQESKSILKTFIELDFYLTPRKVHFTEFEESKRVKVIEGIQSTDRNIVILGAPGAGKTTVGKYLCLSLLLRDEKFIDYYYCPIIIKLRDYNQVKESELASLDLIDILFRLLDLKLDSPTHSNYGISFHTEQIKLQVLAKVIDGLKLIIIIDGFDEVVDENLRKRIVNNFERLCSSITEGRIILSSRAADFDYSITNCSTYEICPLTDGQIKEFTRKWLENASKAKILQKQIFSSPFRDTVMRPLTLAHLCAIFERYNKIPEKPKSVYKKIITLLLEEWDTERGIERKSKYSNFEVDRKMEFLSRMAFELSTRYKTLNFSKKEIEKIYKHIHKEFKLPESEVHQVVREIESHNGIFLQSGNDMYEFAHKSLQEFLTAEYIHGLDELPSNKDLILLLPNELAIATTLASNQSAYFSKLVLTRLKPEGFNPLFMSPYLTRLYSEKPDFTISELFATASLYINSSFVLQSFGNMPLKSPLKTGTGHEKNKIRLGNTRKSNADKILKANKEPINYSFEELDSLISELLNLEEFRESIKLIGKYYSVDGNSFTFKHIKSRKYYMIKSIKNLSGEKKAHFPKSFIVESKWVKYFC